MRALAMVLAGSLAGSLLAAAACSAKNVTVDVPITAYVPAGCGSVNDAEVTFTGLGDFPQPTPAAETVSLSAAGVSLTALPSSTKQVVLTPVTDAAPWAGSALVPDAGGVSVLTLPMGTACGLTASLGFSDDPGVTFGTIDATHAMLVGATLPPATIDLGQGLVTPLSGAGSAMRDYASVTPFGAGAALIAGGVANNGQIQSTAVVYAQGSTPGSGTFSAPIPLSGQRSQHGAALLSDGRVLLIGGVTQVPSLVTTIDVLTPGASTADASTLPASAALHVGRAQPTVITLSNGQIFVGGGFDMNGLPIASAEWLAPDLTWLGMQTFCSAALEQGFAATEGGAVLAVMGEAATAGCSNVHLLLSSGVTDAPPLAYAPGYVRLFQGAEASPLLLTDQDTARWNPWTGLFTSLGANAAGLNTPTHAILAPSPGLALWLSMDGSLLALRFDTHGEYATDVAHGPYLVTDDLYTAPDQLPVDGGNVSFSPVTGAVLTNGATVWLTDATYAELTATVGLRDGGTVIVVLRDPAGSELVCTATGVPSEGTVQVVRNGSQVVASLGDAGSYPCSGDAGTLDPNVRVSVGVRGPPLGSGTTTVKSFWVQR